MSDARHLGGRLGSGSECTSRASATVTPEDADWLAGHLRAMMATRPAAWASSDLTLPQLTALHFIRAQSPITLVQLSEALGTGPPATCAMVDRLARAGLVHRLPDPDDHRRIRLAITREAEPMIGKIDLTTAKRLQAVINGMSPSARRCLTEVLRTTARQFVQ